ncbi:MAG TPA: hypothetical protein VGN26_18075 [Armatimonadota bacterium]|jgi:hypothetical protein
MGTDVLAATTVLTPDPDSLDVAVDLRDRLRGWGLGERRQGGRPTCSVFAVVGALEFAAASRRGRGERLSVEFANYAAHKHCGRSEDGGFFSEIWDGFAAYGACPEETLPYQQAFDATLEPPSEALEAAAPLKDLGLRLAWIKEWNPETGVTEDQLAEIRRVLREGWPVCGGFRWPKQATWEANVLQVVPPEEVFDGHSILLIGYAEPKEGSGDGLFLTRDSGGDGRDRYVPFEHARRYMNDAAWISHD